MKKILTVLLIAIIATGGLSACGNDVSDAHVSSTSEIYIPVIALGYSSQFWQAVKQGCEEAASDYGVKITFEGPVDETMVDKQVDILKTSLQNNPEAICMAAIDLESVRQILEEQKAKGIPIVAFDAGLGEDIPNVTCSVDNTAAGAMAAEHAAEAIGNKGKIGIIGHSETVPDAVARVQGFADKIAKDYPDIEIVDIQYADGDHLKSAEAVKGMLAADSEIQLVYTTNEGATVGTYNGIKELGKIGQVQIIGFDSSAALKAAVRNGDIIGAITQDPVTEGYKTVETAVKLLKGDDLGTTFIDCGFYWYNKDNMDSSEIAPCLYD